jgi:hypothetical protein
MKPILFNTDMVRAILEGRKTVTRRAIKPQPDGALRPMGQGSCWPGYFADTGEERVLRPPYQPGDVLYVRETWAKVPVSPGGHFRPNGVYYYKAGPVDVPEGYLRRWSPSIHMPREAARIFLRVKSVREERLQHISSGDVLREGIEPEDFRGKCKCAWENEGCMDRPCANRDGYIEMCHWMPFMRLWDKTVKGHDRTKYSWEANPWVWVIEFERISEKEV